MSPRYFSYASPRGHTAMIGALAGAFIIVAGPPTSVQWDLSLRGASAPAIRVSLDDNSAVTPTLKLQIRAVEAVVPARPELAVAARGFSLAAIGADSLTHALAFDCMTAAIYYEAAHEPVTGQRAIAQVILNRVKHPAFPDTVCGVVFQGSERATGCQFTFTCDGSLSQTPSPGLWLRARSVAASALNGLVEKSVGHATHYHASYVRPYWAPKLTKLTTIGSHIFYQWDGSASRPSAFTDQYEFKEVMPLNARAALRGYLAAPGIIAPDSPFGPATHSSTGSSNLAGIAPFVQTSSAHQETHVTVSALPTTNLTVRKSEMIETGARLKDSSKQPIAQAKSTLSD